MPLTLAAEVHTPMSDPWIWGGFVIFVIVAMFVDLLLYRRSSGALSTRAAVVWSVIWIALALAFNAVILITMGTEPAEEFLAGYLLEKSLSVDNLFVFVLVFAFFRTPPREQRRVLVWGIVGAMVLRAIMILAGAALIHKFHYTLAFFGLFLVYTGIKLVFHDEADDPADSKMIRFLRRILPLTEGPAPGTSSESARLVDGAALGYRGSKFMVFEGGKRKFTTLFLVLLVIEGSDVVFAVDSVPAIFGVTNDPFIVFTSNIFALLGLRALFFVIAAAIQRLRYLNIGLSIVLSFIGLKMLLPFGAEAYHAYTGRVPELPLLESQDDTEFDLDLRLEAGASSPALEVPPGALELRQVRVTAAVPAGAATDVATLRVYGLKEAPADPLRPPSLEGAVLLGEGQVRLPAAGAALPLGRAEGQGAEEVEWFFVRVEEGELALAEVGVVFGSGLHVSSFQSLLVICVVLGSTTLLSLLASRGDDGPPLPAPPPVDPGAEAGEEAPPGGAERGGAEPPREERERSGPEPGEGTTS